MIYKGYHWTSTPGVRCDVYISEGGGVIELVYVQSNALGSKELFRAKHGLEQIEGISKEARKLWEGV